MTPIIKLQIELLRARAEAVWAAAEAVAVDPDLDKYTKYAERQQLVRLGLRLDREARELAHAE
jgi:hypothetical protein